MVQEKIKWKKGFLSNWIIENVKKRDDPVALTSFGHQKAIISCLLRTEQITTRKKSFGSNESLSL